MEIDGDCCAGVALKWLLSHSSWASEDVGLKGSIAVSEMNREQGLTGRGSHYWEECDFRNLHTPLTCHCSRLIDRNVSGNFSTEHTVGHSNSNHMVIHVPHDHLAISASHQSLLTSQYSPHPIYNQLTVTSTSLCCCYRGFLLPSSHISIYNTYRQFQIFIYNNVKSPYLNILTNILFVINFFQHYFHFHLLV